MSHRFSITQAEQHLYCMTFGDTLKGKELVLQVTHVGVFLQHLTHGMHGDAKLSRFQVNTLIGPACQHLIQAGITTSSDPAEGGG